MKSASEIFYSQVRGANIMTPAFIGLDFAGENHVYELTSGRGLEHEPIYGVTIVTKRRDGTWFHDYERSHMFFSPNAALKYVHNIEEGE